jgi:hypothetical protein
MKKRLLAMLLAAVMIFVIAACETTTEPDVDPVNTVIDEVNGENNEEPTDEGDPETCADCGEPEWNCACDKIAKINDFNALQGERGDRELINIYTFTDETVDMLNFFLQNTEDFGEDYFIQLEFNTNAQAHRTAVSLNVNNTGDDGVDLFVADVDYAMEFADLPGTATIADLGIEINESEYYAYTLDLMRKGDDIMGLSHQATPGAMYYRADVASEILGIESEDEMQALVSDWDGFIEVAQQIVDGAQDMKILAGADELKRNFINARTEGWVVDGDFNIDFDTIEEFVEVTEEIMDMGGLKVNAGSQQWSGSWNEGMESGVFAYFGSTWYLHYILKGNSGSSFGQWGMIPGPQSFFWGGTYWFGSKVAADNEAKAEAVKQIIEFFCVNDESIIAYMSETGDFPSKKSVVEATDEEGDLVLKATDEQKSFFLFETDHYPVFSTIADRIDITKNITKYDDVMNSLFDDFINNVFSDGMSVDEAIDAMSEGVRANAPSVTVR